MLIKVGKFIFHVDFVVIDMEEDKQIPLLLGRSFLATGAALIDVKKGELTLIVGKEEVHFNLNQSLKQPNFDNVIEPPYLTRPGGRTRSGGCGPVLAYIHFRIL